MVLLFWDTEVRQSIVTQNRTFLRVVPTRIPGFIRAMSEQAQFLKRQAVSRSPSRLVEVFARRQFGDEGAHWNRFSKARDNSRRKITKTLKFITKQRQCQCCNVVLRAICKKHGKYITQGHITCWPEVTMKNDSWAWDTWSMGLQNSTPTLTRNPTSELTLTQIQTTILTLTGTHILKCRMLNLFMCSN